MITTLEKLGLSEKEAKVYLATMELGEDTVQNIAKKSGVNRPTTYFILEKLMKMGLASTVTKGKKTMFIAENPRELEHILEKQKREIEDRKEELKETMNQLMAIYNSHTGKPVVKYFEGADGLEALDRYGRNYLKKNSEAYGFSPLDIVEKQFSTRRKNAISERVKLGIRSKVIYTSEAGEIPKERNKAELREGVHIPQDKFPLNAAMTIYPELGIKLFYYDLVKPFGVMLESKELAKNMKVLFDLAWLGAKSLKKK